MHKCIPYANNNIFMMIRNWVLTGMGGTDKSVPYELPLQIPIYRGLCLVDGHIIFSPSANSS